MTKPSKARVRESFERAAPSYDRAATVQRRICSTLNDGLPAMAPERILDAGCGTGFAINALATRFPASDLLAIDLSPAMLRRTPDGCQRIAGDLENLPLPDASLDLYWSSLAVQWCDLTAALREAYRTLRSDGWLALASLGPETFRELRHAFAGVDDYQHTLGFHNDAEIRKIAIDAGFATVNLKNGLKIENYADFRSLLRGVKASGANQLGAGRRTGLMSRTAFQRAEAAIEALRTPHGLPLTYDVVYLYARK